MSVSVCMAAFNGAAYIREQIDSILISPLVDELIVSDDASTDGTVDIIKSIADARLVLIEGPGAGLIRNFEHALSKAKGEVVFLADQDDIWMPNKVERVLSALEGVDVVVTDCRVVDGALKEVCPSFFRLNHSAPGLLRNLAKNGYLGCCMAVRRRVLDVALPFPPDIAMHDWWLGLVAERIGRVCFLDEVLSLYRRHGGNASVTGQRSCYPWLLRLQWRIYLAACLLFRKLSPMRNS